MSPVSAGKCHNFNSWGTQWAFISFGNEQKILTFVLIHCCSLSQASNHASATISAIMGINEHLSVGL